MEKIEEWATAERLDAVACAVKATARLIEEIILDEVADGQAALGLAGRTISGLQAIVLAGRNPEEVTFPAELFGQADVSSTGSPVAENTPPSEPVPAPAAPAPQPINIEGDPALLADFVGEAREHLESADIHLLNLETDPSNEESIHSVFRAFHTIKGVAGLLGLTQIGQLAHEAENLLDRVRKHEVAICSRVIDAIFETTDMLKRQISALKEMLENGTQPASDPGLPALLQTIRRVSQGDVGDQPAAETGDEPRRKLGEILVEQGSVSAEDVNAALQRQSDDPGHPKLGSVLVEEGKVAREGSCQCAAHAEQRAGQGDGQSRRRPARPTRRHDRRTRHRRVDGEPVVQVGPDGRDLPAAPQRTRQDHARVAADGHVVADGSAARHIPEDGAARPRPVQEVGQAGGFRDGRRGHGTRQDRRRSDRRSPCAYGAQRGGPWARGQRRGPRRRGQAGCRARRVARLPQGGNIYIEIEDDGRGLDREAILAKGRERGLIAEGETPADRDIYNMIFQPGFSTARKITDVSGRGVGMDVVKRNIDSLRGQVEIRTEVGRGSTFSIRLPLTLAIIDGMVVRVGAERYIIPTLSVLISLRPEPGQLSTALGTGQMLAHQGRQLPLFRLDEIFGIDGAEQDPTRALAVVVEDDGRQVVLLVDELLGQQQIVIKSLGESVRGIPGISGGAIMPDGKVGLILDVGGVLRLAQRKD